MAEEKSGPLLHSHTNHIWAASKPHKVGKGRCYLIPTLQMKKPRPAEVKWLISSKVLRSEHRGSQYPRSGH